MSVDVQVADRDFKKAHPLLQLMLLDFFQELGKRKVSALVTEVWRHNDRQAWLHASGRTRPGPILTHAKPGESYHNLVIDGVPLSAAADFAIWDEDTPWSKSLEWNGTAKEWKLFDQAAKKVGLVTLSFEKPHVQLPWSLSQIRAGKIPSPPVLQLAFDAGVRSAREQVNAGAPLISTGEAHG